jgi:hypothetical protein
MKVYNLRNFQTIYNACKLAQDHKMVVLIEGASGLGKSFAFDYYALKNSNVYKDELQSADSPRHPWERLLVKVQEDNFIKGRYDLAELSTELVSSLNIKENPNLVILDEAGFLNFRMLRHFRSLRDRTKRSTGYIISGPDYFIDNLKTWIKNKVPGMNELDTRIDIFVKLAVPDHKEKKFVCKKEGIVDPTKIREISSRVDNFRDLFREISFYHQGIEGRNEWEWEKGYKDELA